VENKLIHSIAQRLTDWVSQYQLQDELRRKKILLAIEIFIINMSKLILIYGLAMLLRVVPLTLSTHGAYALLRRYSFGLHALNSTVCTVTSVCLFVLVPWSVYGIMISNSSVILFFAIIVLCLYLYSPADTKARPLIGKKVRQLLKKKAILSGIVLMLITLFISNESIKFLITMGASYQVISILPITYKILKRSEKNYEYYEKQRA